jgi:hypothetical protein
MRALLPVALVALVLALAPVVSAQIVDWTRQFGSAAYDTATGISVDASGVYVGGTTIGTLPGQASAGDRDAFVRKYDLAGAEVWTRQFGTSSYDVGNAISVDASGVYVAGATIGTLPSQASAGGLDAFVRKYDLAGVEVWTRQFGTAADDNADGISVDASGVYVAGTTAGTFSGQASAGDRDAFVRKYDLAGAEVWTRQFGTSSYDSGNGISVDASGVYVGGRADGTLPSQASAGGSDAFVRKYDLAGAEVWTHQFGTSSIDVSNGISVDTSGVYVGGYTDGTLPGQASAGGRDAFVRKYDLAGAEVWTHQFGTAASDSVFPLSIDASGVYVAGTTAGTFSGQASAGGSDAFVRKYDLAGAEVWTHQFGTAGGDGANGIADHASSVYVAGSTSGTFSGQSSAGDEDAFVVKLVSLAILGFYHPVDMGGVLNTVKNGATVPLKFEVFEGATELTDTAVVQSLTLTQVACTPGDPTDAIEITATGGTSLRYDTTAGQFVYNWQTPKMGNTCWDVRLTIVDGSSITAHFRLR